jgi:hypothetical protein
MTIVIVQETLFSASRAQHASRAGIIFNVAIKSRPPAAHPVVSGVVGSAGPVAFEAEKDVPRGVHDDSHMPAPHDQIARLRLEHALKTFHAIVQIV